MEDNWIRCEDEQPAIDRVVMTKIDDANGCRNESPLKRVSTGEGRYMWFHADGEMYVYYRPTHWRPLTDAEFNSIRDEILLQAKEIVRTAETLKR